MFWGIIRIPVSVVWVVLLLVGILYLIAYWTCSVRKIPNEFVFIWNLIWAYVLILPLPLLATTFEPQLLCHYIFQIAPHFSHSYPMSSLQKGTTNSRLTCFAPKFKLSLGTESTWLEITLVFTYKMDFLPPFGDANLSSFGFSRQLAPSSKKP